MNCRNAKMNTKTRVWSAILAAIFGNYGSHKLIHKQYLEMLMYILSQGFFYLGAIIDTLVYIFDPDFTTYQAENGPLKKFRTYEFVAKIVGTIICFGYFVYDYASSFYLYGNVPALKLVSVVLVVVITVLVNSIVYCCRGSCCKEVNDSPLQDEEGINEPFEGIVDQSDLVTPKRIREHLIWYVIGLMIWLCGFLYYILGRSKYTTLVKNPKYYEEEYNSLKESFPEEAAFMGIEESDKVLFKEHTIAIGKNTYKYRINYMSEYESQLKDGNENIVIFYSNPEKSREQEYRPVMERLVSWGYIVVGNDDAMSSHSGEVLAEVIKDFDGQGYKHHKIGIVGIKLGASGAIKAVTEHLDKSITIDALYLCELYSQSILKKYGETTHTYDPKLIDQNINIMVVEAGGIFSDLYMNEKDWQNDVKENLVESRNGLALRLITAFPDKVMPSDDGLLTGWLEGQFDNEAKAELWRKLKVKVLDKNPRWKS